MERKTEMMPTECILQELKRHIKGANSLMLFESSAVASRLKLQWTPDCKASSCPVALPLPWSRRPDVCLAFRRQA